MGKCNSSPAPAASEIRKWDKENKLLLLDTGNSGKTTFYKQLHNIVDKLNHSAVSISLLSVFAMVRIVLSIPALTLFTPMRALLTAAMDISQLRRMARIATVILLLFATKVSAAEPTTVSPTPPIYWDVFDDTINTTAMRTIGRACGFHADTQQLFVLDTGTYSVYDIATRTFADAVALDASVSIGGTAQNHRQIGSSVFFLSSHKPGRFEMDTHTLHYPLSAASNVTFTAYGQRACLAVSADANFLFVTGGSSSSVSWEKMNKFEIYDVAQDARIDGPDLPVTALASHACAIQSDGASAMLFVFGGDYGGDKDDVYAIDVSDPSSLGSWIELDPLQIARNGVRAVNLDGLIYVLGGSSVDTLNPHNNQLSVAASAPYALSKPCVAVDETAHVIYAAGDTEGRLLTMSTIAPTPNPTDAPYLALFFGVFGMISVPMALSLICVGMICSRCSRCAMRCHSKCSQSRHSDRDSDRYQSDVQFNIELKMSQPKSLKISNALGVIVSIGQYEDIEEGEVGEPEIECLQLRDLPVEKDVSTLRAFFKFMNFDVLPRKDKVYWTEADLMAFLEKDGPVARDLFDAEGELNYDAIIVAVTGHGLKHHIVTSDLRVIEKAVIYRLLSLRHPRVRDIPRIFLFDVCDGALQRANKLFERKPDSPDSPDSEKKVAEVAEVAKIVARKDVGKCTTLADISHASDWSSNPKNAKNPDFNLVLIQAANLGYQAKMNPLDGSYLIREFTQRMESSVRRRDNKPMGEIAEEVQDDLHERGKQQTINIFNSGTSKLQILPKPTKPKSQNESKRRPTMAGGAAKEVEQALLSPNHALSNGSNRNLLNNKCRIGYNSCY